MVDAADTDDPTTLAHADDGNSPKVLETPRRGGLQNTIVGYRPQGIPAHDFFYCPGTCLNAKGPTMSVHHFHHGRPNRICLIGGHETG